MERTVDWLGEKAAEISRGFLDAHYRMCGITPLTDEEWAEYNSPENIELRRKAQEVEKEELEKDRAANPDKYTCPHCGRDYED